MIWHSASLNDIKNELSADFENGLTEEQVAKRAEEFGPNRLNAAPPKSFFRRFIEQLKSFMVLILLLAAVVSLLTNLLSSEQNWLEPVVILAIVIINALLGVFQESRAEQALEALKTMAAPSAKVIRRGKADVIDASQLVPGDIILLEAGDFIPADARIIEEFSLKCDESALTGESLPADKNATDNIDDIAVLGDRENMVYSGCSVSCGRAKAVVTETGMQTEMGKIASMLQSSSGSLTPLQEKLEQLGKSLGMMVLLICVVIFGLGVFTGTESLDVRMLNMLMVAVSLAVAAIPEGLPAIVTIVLSIGVQRMVKRRAIVRRLPAVETLGSTSVICTDKTGTLTQNKMTLVKAFVGGRLTDDFTAVDPQLTMLFRLGSLCSDAKVEVKDGRELIIGDPTEAALVTAAQEHTNMSKSEIDNAYPRLGEIPFDSDRKLMTTVNMLEGKPVAIVKGAPDVLIKKCSHVNAKAVEQANSIMAAEALRVLAIAFKPLDEAPPVPTSEDLECDLHFVGLVGLIDPPRNDVMQSIAKCKTAGIKTVMITGDHIVTAAAIAKKLGILEDGMAAITGAELNEMSDDELAERLDGIRVYARVAPEDKIRIVKAWQARGEIVAMTGDGVNDAPALKAADIGCAMGITGTDVAKGASDMTLTDDNFSTIVSAVQEGRNIYDNIKKSVRFLVGCNIGEILTVLFALIIGWGAPLSAIQLLWLNLVTDSLPAAALGYEPAEPDIMEREPVPRNENIVNKEFIIDIAWQGAMFAVITLIAYYMGRFGSGEENVALAHTMAFATLAISQLIHSFNIRSEHSLFRVGIIANKKLVASFFISLLLVAAVIVTPLRGMFGLALLNGSDWLKVGILSLVPLVVSEIAKIIKRRAHKAAKNTVPDKNSVSVKKTASDENNVSAKADDTTVRSAADSEQVENTTEVEEPSSPEAEPDVTADVPSDEVSENVPETSEAEEPAPDESGESVEPDAETAQGQNDPAADTDTVGSEEPNVSDGDKTEE